MAMQIYPKTIAGHTYYYAQRSYREKVLPGAPGKTKGSGKSRVRSETLYLGSAESIVAALSKTRQPLEVRHREFGREQEQDRMRRLNTERLGSLPHSAEDPANDVHKETWNHAGVLNSAVSSSD